MPNISIILPAYNGADYIGQSIDSVIAQSYSDWELIIIDDCSNDGTAEVINSYVESDKRVKYFRNDKNLKLPASLNKGFEHASGEYLTWTSCDNLYLPNALEKMVTVLKNNSDIGLVYSTMQLIDEHGELCGVLNAGPEDELILRNVVGACFMYRRDIAEQVGRYNTKLFLCEDYEYWLRIASVSSIQPIDECLYQYRRHSGSLSYNNEKEIIAKGIDVQKSFYSKFIKNRDSAALFYAHLRARDIYNPFRQLYLFVVLYFSPTIFFKEITGLITRRF